MKSMKKVLISLLIFLTIAIIFGSVTFAWVTLSTVSNIDGFSLTASAGEDLELSVDGINYYNKLPSDVIQTLISEITLIDITSQDGINFTTGGLRKISVPIPNEHYISFDLWIRTARPEKHIYLINHIDSMTDFDTTQVGTYAISRGVTWIARHGFFNGPDVSDWVPTGSIDRYYASQAVRMSFIELKDNTNPTDQRNEQDLRRFIFDPSNNPSRGFGVPFGQFSYFFQKTRWHISLPTVIPEVSYRLTTFDPREPYQALDNDSWIATLQATSDVDDRNRQYYQAKIRINIWIEGWDADAFDAIDKDRIKFQLQFRAANPPIHG